MVDFLPQTSTKMCAQGQAPILFTKMQYSNSMHHPTGKIFLSDINQKVESSRVLYLSSLENLLDDDLFPISLDKKYACFFFINLLSQ